MKLYVDYAQLLKTLRLNRNRDAPVLETPNAPLTKVAWWQANDGYP